MTGRFTAIIISDYLKFIRILEAQIIVTDRDVIMGSVGRPADIPEDHAIAASEYDFGFAVAVDIIRGFIVGMPTAKGVRTGEWKVGIRAVGAHIDRHRNVPSLL